MALGDFDLLEHRSSDVVDDRSASGRALGGQQGTIHCHDIETRRHAANREAEAVAGIVKVADHPGKPHRHFARVEVGQIAELIHRDHILHVVGVAFRGDGRSKSLALPGHLEGVEFVDLGRQVEIADNCSPRWDVDRDTDRIESGIRHRHCMRTGRQRREHIAAGRIRKRLPAQRLDPDPGAFEEIAGGDVAHVASERGSARERGDQSTGGLRQGFGASKEEQSEQEGR